MHHYTLILLFFISNAIHAQDTVPKIPKWSFNGYVKLVETIEFDQINQTNTSGHLIHNRLNLKWKPNSATYFVGELRNRILFGEAGSVNDKPVFKSEIERLYTDIQVDKWNLRLGRQRVNWGIATIWNPNDIFNAYNFLDVDYEERPGSDAIKLKYNFSSFAHLELVHSGFGKNQISAAKYFINKGGYDFQFIAGNYKGDPTIGTGWAGNMKNAGFKGEIQYYTNQNDALKQLNLTIGFDYMFKKGWYLNTGFLYNSQGLNEKLQANQYLNLQLSSKNLMPTRHNMLIMLQKDLNPLSSFGLSVIYAPNVDLLLIMPSFKFNMVQDLDADIIWQSFYINRASKFQSLNSLGFFRLRWSF